MGDAASLAADEALADTLRPPKRKHRYSAEVEAVMRLARATAAETDGWNTLPEVNGVTITQKEVSGAPTGILRGVLRIPNFTPDEVLSTVLNADTRPEWDSLFDNGRVAETLDPSCNSVANYIVTKKQFPTNSRDMLLIGSYEKDPDGTAWSAFRSISDPAFPEYPDRVRMTADLVAWRLAPYVDGDVSGTEAMYIAQTNPSGWIPSSVLKLVAAATPQCTFKVARYLRNRGPPPMLQQWGCDLISSSLDRETYKYSLALKVLADWKTVGPTRIFVSKKSFPSGFTVETVPAEVGVCRWIESTSQFEMRLTALGPVTVTLKRRSSGPFSVSLMGKDIFPVPEPTVADSTLVAPNGSAPAQPVLTGEQMAALLHVHTPSRSVGKHVKTAECEKLLAFLKTTYHDSLRSSQWTRSSPSNGVNVWRRDVPNHHVGFIKCTATIPGVTPDQVAAIIETPACRSQIDSLFAELRLVASFGERASILHMVLNGFAVVVSARDACILQVAERTNEGHVWIASQSVSDPACPVHPDRVRTEVGLGGWYLELAYEGKNRPVTRLTHLFLFDAKGWVPKALHSLYLQAVPNKVTGIQQAAASGPPPAVVAIAGPLESLPQFDLATSRFVLQYRADAKRTTILSVHPIRYPNGYEVAVTPATQVVVKRYETTGHLVIATPTASDVVVTVTITARSPTEPPSLPRVNGVAVESIREDGTPADDGRGSHDVSSLAAERQRLLNEIASLKKQLEAAAPATATPAFVPVSQLAAKGKRTARGYDLVLIPLISLAVGYVLSSSLLFLGASEAL